jgi:hypothetical protein
MSTPEMGSYSLEEYEDGKCFIVKPGRLCVEGVYTLAYKLGMSAGSQLHIAKVEEVIEVECEDGASHVVCLSLADEYRPTFYRPGEAYLFDQAGFMRISSDRGGLIEEAYLRHRFEDLDNGLVNIKEIKTAPSRVATMPFDIT